MPLDAFLQYLAQGVSLGSTYAAIAVGYTIIYGVLGLINMAHGDFFMAAAFLAMWANTRYNVPLELSLILGAVSVVIGGVLVERVAYRPLREVKISAFTSTVAVSMVIETSFVLFFTPRPQPFPRPEPLTRVLQVGNVFIPATVFAVIAVAAVLFVVLMLIVNRTKMGRAMRALSKDMETTELMGANVGHIMSFSFALSTAFAAAAGFMFCNIYPSIDPFGGVTPGLKGFIGAVVGGIGSIPGALIGGFFLGLAEIMLVAFLPAMSGFRDAFAYAILIAFLLFRPGGLFNVRVREEKV
ncbi:MAG: branched-chain amino acid ABC transporter permease [Sphingomonadaceae bacterium]